MFIRPNTYEHSVENDNAMSSALPDNHIRTSEDSIIRNSETIVTWKNPNFITFCPFKNNTDNDDAVTSEFYTDIANDVCNITNGEATDLTGSEAYPGNLITMADSGFFVMDSYNVSVNVGGDYRSYIMMHAGDTSKYEYAADLSAGHIITSNSGVGVTGSFFTKYFERENKTLPGTLIYMDTCSGVATDTLFNPLLDLGATLVAGHDESASFTCSEAIWRYMVTDCPENPARAHIHLPRQWTSLKNNVVIQQIMYNTWEMVILS